MTDDIGVVAPAASAADALGLPYEVVAIPRVGSLEEAARALGISPRQVAKTLVIRLGGHDYRLVLVPGDRQLDWEKLRAVLGVKRAAMPTPDEAAVVTGFERGTIGPLGTTTVWPVVMDEAVAGPINIGSGVHGIGLIVDAEQLAKAVDALVADVSS